MEKKIFDTDYGAILVTLDPQHEVLLISGPTGYKSIPYYQIFNKNQIKKEILISATIASLISSITILMLCINL